MDPDDCFRALVRLMHQYIKSTHHLVNLRETARDTGPRSLQKVASWLGSVSVAIRSDAGGRLEIARLC